jgi:hypothetical protein
MIKARGGTELQGELRDIRQMQDMYRRIKAAKNGMNRTDADKQTSMRRSIPYNKAKHPEPSR